MEAAVGQQEPGFTQALRRRWLAGHAEAVAFWVMVFAYLAPIWAFRYVPTQDGPAHVFNAQILREYGQSAAGYEQFFELRQDPLPNLTSHVLLAALLSALPPLLSEKVLVSLYVVGFAAALRYFLGAFGAACRPVSWLGLLFVYHRFFWLGFYNYCLGVALLWAILGYCVRRRECLHLPQAAVLLLLFTLTYFTHLVCFVLAWPCAVAATLWLQPRRPLAAALVCLAGLPAACLTIDYFDQTGFFQDTAARRLVDHPLARLGGGMRSASVRQDLIRMDRELFEFQAGSRAAFTLSLLPLYALLGACTFARSLRPALDADCPGRLLPFMLGLLFLAAYLLAPSTLDAHGGFLKQRLAILPPLAWLACLSEPARAAMRIASRAGTLGLLAANLFLVTNAIAQANQELAEYTAGLEAFGRGHRLFVIQGDRHPELVADPLLHASNYYCLGTDSVNLNNYETNGAHFPVRFRPGLHRGRGRWTTYPNQDIVDTVLCWQTTPAALAEPPAGWDVVFDQGRLRLYRRPAGSDEDPSPHLGDPR
jgi:hypothetical protein